MSDPRQLRPIIWLHRNAAGKRLCIVDHDIAMLPGDTREPYELVRQCQTCVNFKAFKYRGEHGGFSCVYPLGLKGARQDGTSSCSYHIEQTP